MRCLIAVAVTLFVVAVAAMKPAQACPPTVRLAGDRALVAVVSPVLVDRGIVIDGNGCPATSVNLERRGRTLLVSIAAGAAGDSCNESKPCSDTSGDRTIQRAVTDPRTAATVIESWVRTSDVEAPLLARHQLDDAGPKDLAPLVAGPPSPSPPTRGIQVFAAGESALASDGSAWFGLQVGGCVMLGWTCASAQARFATVARGAGRWQENLDRHGAELLLGADLPLRFASAVLSPGLAAGVGWIHTHEDGAGRGEAIGGLRAQGHLLLSYPFSQHLAVELALSFEVTQAEHVETSSYEPLPNQPRWLGRLGLGMRMAGL